MNRNMLFAVLLGLGLTLPACNQNTNANQSQATVVFANEIDYICDMKVQAHYTDTCHYQGKVYAFCSESCKEAFQAEPETYLSRAGNE